MEEWTEIWSEGKGPARVYCGVATTETEFAVDLFHGDTCVASWVFTSFEDAEQAAWSARTPYARASA
jgi:hypothetical protein